ncbi:hypothetical protein [Aliidiomarina sanyensis]|uniref:Uncharacterized protein n=1 Tax=Aliidiomarina sanyensis TaxID=1249555 RepID=A0A432WI91_9GAMM|nr:hypothetical protein [Aliidiomarina sanyensis]RUO33510.1 hypothetical protein CWE11_06630 [Aliidiomarina sanyensis]
MSQTRYDFIRHRSPRPRRQRHTATSTLQYIERALACLQAQPEKISVIRDNVTHYEAQPHLPKAARNALKRFQYVLAVTDDPQEIARWILEDSEEGRKFRQFPLLLKGVCDDEDN